jgi:hypothetical protein
MRSRKSCERGVQYPMGHKLHESFNHRADECMLFKFAQILGFDIAQSVCTILVHPFKR